MRRLIRRIVRARRRRMIRLSSWVRRRGGVNEDPLILEGCSLR